MGYRQIVRGHVDSIARGINVAKRATQRARARHGQPDLHLGAPGAAHSGAHPHRSGAGGRGPRGRDDGHRADRSATPAASQVTRGDLRCWLWRRANERVRGLDRTAADLCRRRGDRGGELPAGAQSARQGTAKLELDGGAFVRRWLGDQSVPCASEITPSSAGPPCRWSTRIHSGWTDISRRRQSGRSALLDQGAR